MLTAEPIIDGYGRLACLSDVHGNTAALDAVFESEEFAGVEAVVFLGCLTTGPEPIGVLDRCAGLSIPAYFIRGNGERGVIEVADGVRDDGWATGPWLVDRHGPAGVDTIRRWPAAVTCAVAGLGTAYLCHASPRSDIELLTSETTPDRILEATAGIADRVVVHGHTHLQYERTVGELRIIAPGSVGLPYDGGPFGARWAILGPTVQLLTTPYDLSLAQERVRASGYPNPTFLQLLEQPPSPDGIIADAESRHFSD